MHTIKIFILNWFQSIYVDYNILITDTEFMFTFMQLIENAFFRVSRPSHRKMEFGTWGSENQCNSYWTEGIPGRLLPGFIGDWYQVPGYQGTNK